MKNPIVHSFFDKATFTVSHVVADPETKKAAIIDSVMDFDPVDGQLSHGSADRIVELVNREGYEVVYILETHAHADHVTAAQYLKEKYKAPVAIGERITKVQEVFKTVYNEPDTFKTDGSQFDHLWRDGEEFSIGSLTGKVIFTPGHTPADVSYLIGDALFVGDSIFMPDYGTARCDFPGGDATVLYSSIQDLYALPNETRVYLCHDYLPAGRGVYTYSTTLGEEKQKNIHVHEGVSEEEFVTMRNNRDRTLSMPRLIIPSIQINIRAGHLPVAEANGVSYLKTPVNGPFVKQII